MAKGNLVAFETMSEMKEAFSPFPGTKETWIFSILRAVRPSPDIRELDVVRKTFCFKIILQDFCPPRTETQVNINWHELVMDRDSFTPFTEKVEKSQAILSAGDPHQDSVSLLQQTIVVDCFSH
jgi:hypothetical protein